MRPTRWLPFVALLALIIGGLPLGAQNASRAAVVIRFDDETAISKCVSFGEEQINGYELLERSGLTLDAQFEGLGGIVCGIGGTGCAAGDCLCACRGGGECVYWSYWIQADDGWQYAQIGATSQAVQNGQVEGWSWGPGSLTDAIEPPLMRFEDICGIPTGSQIDLSSTQANEPLSFGPIIAFGGIVILLVVILLMVSRKRPSE
jgi:hypothetical protein